MNQLLLILLGALIGFCLCLLLAFLLKKSAKKSAAAILKEANLEIKELNNKQRALSEEATIKLEKKELYLIQREKKVDDRFAFVFKETERLKVQAENLHKIKRNIDVLGKKQEEKLIEISNLTPLQAREEIIQITEKQYSDDLSRRIQKIQEKNDEQVKIRAQEILVTVIQRLASSTATEITTTTVSLPNEDMKGKIIGKEGKNIRAFERETGVELIVDDVPEAVLISSFDPIRRQVARVALEKLLEDGRIQPAKIEEFVDDAKKSINMIIKEKGDAAVYETGIFNLDPRITAILGRLYFRTSYGQNVLNHSIEMAHLAGMLAEELGADVQIAKAGALLHDIGKALDHEVQGTHIEIGIRILEKFGADPRIITAMKSHHDDCPHETLEAVIVQVCDIISGSRPGARRDSIERYIKRLKELEALAGAFPEVIKCYALSAGREIRIFVKPLKTSDLSARRLAQKIAMKIESDLKYPGEIKVTVIRENRIIQYAR